MLWQSTCLAREDYRLECPPHPPSLSPHGPLNQIPEACEEGFKLSVMPFIKLANETVSPFANYNLNVIPKLRHFVRMTIESED